MPIYEYSCPTCDHEFELLVRGSEQPTCPSCQGAKLERQLSVPAAHTGGRSSGAPAWQAPIAPT